MTFLWFGIYNPEFSRNKVYIRGLQQLGHTIIECRDDSRGLIKYWRLWKRLRAFKGKYDVLVVGYPGHIVVPFARLITSKRIIFDALCTRYEALVLSRGLYGNNPLAQLPVRISDSLAVHCADLVLVESESQREYFIKRFSPGPSKIAVVYTGADESVYYPDSSIPKLQNFTVLFRGKFLPEAGVKYVVQATKLLESENIDVRIIGSGHVEEEVRAEIARHEPRNLEWISEHLDPKDLHRKMLECHISLGQFEKHERLARTIPHKAFEALAIGFPYITGRARAAEEIFQNGENCLLVNPADPEDLAEKILELRNNTELRNDLASNARKTFLDRLSQSKLAETIVKLSEELLRR